MSHDALLPHTARVFSASGSADRFGQPASALDNDAPQTATVPCRLVTAKSGSILNDERTVFVFEDKYVMHTGPDAAVEEDDVVQIVDAAGVELLPKTRIKLKKPVFGFDEMHHIEFELESRRGPQ